MFERIRGMLPRRGSTIGRTSNVRGNVQHIPDATNFQREYVGTGLTGNSQIVPFAKTLSGQFFIPGGPTKNNFMK